MAVSLDYEKELGDRVMGIDEAGRGPLVGGVYAAAVSVPLAQAEELLAGAWSEINDSKKLTERKREKLAEVIKSTPGCTWAIACASPQEIDRLNILNATHLAMRRAATEVITALGDASIGDATDGDATDGDAASRRIIPPSIPANPLLFPSGLHALVDGLAVKSMPQAKNLVKGDAKSLFIAAASILAKTARDADCLRLEALYPGYGFAQHKGYPTAAHLAALNRLGPCPEHRRSFGPVSQMTLF